MSKGEHTRQLILDEAVKRASVEGLEALSIGSLASELGLSKSGLFAHFRSKENLQLAVLDNGAADFIARVVKPALLKPRGEPRVREMINRWLDWAHRSGPPGGCVFVTASVEFDDRPGPVRDRVQQQQSAWIATLTRAIEISVEEGHFAADLDCAQLTFELQSLMLGSSFYGRLLGDPDTMSRVREATNRLLDAASTPSTTASR
jgi:AcrR family transcriptional regulator